MDAGSKPWLAKGPRPVKAASAIVFAGALATILAALAFEHLGGYAPCPLCLQQRYAYYFAVPASAVGFFFAQGHTTSVARDLLIATAVEVLMDAGIGIYNSGVEETWWMGQDTSEAGAAPESGALRVPQHHDKNKEERRVGT